MFPHVNKIGQNNYSVVMKKHDNKPAESREMRCMFSKRDSPTIALHWDGWNRNTAQNWSIRRLFNRLTKWLENCQMIGHSTILRNSNCQIFSYCLKQLPQKQKFTDLALNQPSGKTRASLWIGDGEVTNSQRSSHWCSKTEEWNCKSYCKRNKDENKKQLSPCKSIMFLHF